MRRLCERDRGQPNRLITEVVGQKVESSQDFLDPGDRVSNSEEPTRSLRGLLAKYGPAPSAEEIDQNRAEMFAKFPRSDF